MAEEIRQLNLLDDFLKPRTMNDWWTAERKGEEFHFERWELEEWQRENENSLSFWFHTTGEKCCGCYPLLRQTKHNFAEKCYAECLVCGRKTEPVDDYFWIKTRKNWNILIRQDFSYDRKGRMREAPKWANAKRCEKCSHWSILPEDLQPADGWGVKGSCTSHRGQGRPTDGFSYCDDFEEIKGPCPYTEKCKTYGVGCGGTTYWCGRKFD